MSLIHDALKKTQENAAKPSAGTASDAAEHMFVQQHMQRTIFGMPPKRAALVIAGVAVVGFLGFRMLTAEAPPPPKPKAMVAVAPPKPVKAAEPKVTKDSEDIIGKLSKAQVLMGQQKYDAAKAVLLKVTEQVPDHLEGWAQLALVYKQLNDNEGASEAFEKAVELGGETPPVELLNNYGVFKMRQGDSMMATLLLRQAVAQLPSYADAHFNLGVLYEGEGNVRSAIESYKSFLQHTDRSDQELIEAIEFRIEEIAP